MTPTLAFLNAKLVCPTGSVSHGGLLIRDGVIAATGTFDVPTGIETVDCQGRMLAPAIVDLGVFTVDRAACHAGGIVRIGLMPDQSPVLDDPGIVQRAALIGKPGLWIHPIAAATKGLAGTDLAEMAINRAAGAKAVGFHADLIGIADRAVESFCDPAIDRGPVGRKPHLEVPLREGHHRGQHLARLRVHHSAGI